MSQACASALVKQNKVEPIPGPKQLASSLESLPHRGDSKKAYYLPLSQLVCLGQSLSRTFSRSWLTSLAARHSIAPRHGRSRKPRAVALLFFMPLVATPQNPSSEGHKLPKNEVFLESIPRQLTDSIPV